MVGWAPPVLLPLFTLAKLDNLDTLDKETSFLETALPVAMTKGRANNVDEIHYKSRAACSEFMYREWVVYHFYEAPITMAIHDVLNIIGTPRDQEPSGLPEKQEKPVVGDLQVILDALLESLHWFAFLRFCQILGISSGYV